MFYLATSCENGGMKEKAIEAYQRRADAGGENDSEKLWSLLHIAQLQEQLKRPPEVVVESFKKAASYCPFRAEPLYHLARYYREIKEYLKCYLVASYARQIPFPEEDPFLHERWVYDHGVLSELAISAYYLGKYDEAYTLSSSILKQPELQPFIKQQVEENLRRVNEVKK
jgi:hypothetical protein